MSSATARNDELLDFDGDSEWVDRFECHKYRHIAGDNRRVLPVCMYIDGIQWTRAHGPGRADSLLAITAYNMATGKRHLLAALSKKECCQCGCRYWCTLGPILSYLRWSLEVAGGKARQVYVLSAVLTRASEVDREGNVGQLSLLGMYCAFLPPHVHRRPRSGFGRRRDGMENCGRLGRHLMTCKIFQ